MSAAAPRSWVLPAILVLTLSNVLVLTRVAQRTLTVRQLSDFGIFYRSARLALDRQNPYRAAADSTTGQRIAAPNLNLPHAIFLMMPLAMVEPGTALAIWLVVSLFSGIVALWIVFREAAIHPTPMAIIVTVFLLSSAAATGAFFMSFQLSWLLWAPATWAWALARRGKWRAAGIVLGFLASIKPFLAVFIAVFVVMSRRRAAALCAISFGACLVGGIAIFGWDVFLSWLQGVRSVAWTGHIFNTSTFGYFDRVFGRSTTGVWVLAPVAQRPELGLILGSLAALIVLCGSLYAVASRTWSDGKPSATEVDRAFAVTFTASLLATPLGWIYYHFLATGPIVVLLANPEWRHSLSWRAAPLALGVVCLTLSPRIVTAGQPSGWATASLGSGYFWGLLMLWWCVLAPTQCRSSRPQRQP